MQCWKYGAPTSNVSSMTQDCCDIVLVLNTLAAKTSELLMALDSIDIPIFGPRRDL
jgi:hypothetical protein